MPLGRKKKTAMTGKTVVAFAVTIMVMAVLVIVGRYGIKALASNRTKTLFDELFGVYQASVYIEENAVASVTDPTSNFPADYLERFRDLYIKNKHIAGWLSIDDTSIYFPIVKGEDNEFYKTRNFLGESLGVGTPYFDTQTKLENDENSSNKIIWLDGDTDGYTGRGNYSKKSANKAASDFG